MNIYILLCILLCVGVPNLFSYVGHRNPFYLRSELRTNYYIQSGIVLAGIATIDGKKAALIKNGHESEVAYEGSTVWGYTVRQIADESVVLIKNDITKVLRL